MRKGLFILAVVFISLFLLGCLEPAVTGRVTANLEKKVLTDGETITMSVSGKNTGKIAGVMTIKIIPEDINKLIVTYPGSLEMELQPGESIVKVISIQGFTDYSSTEYSLSIQLINKDTGKVLDEHRDYVTAKKK